MPPGNGGAVVLFVDVAAVRSRELYLCPAEACTGQPILMALVSDRLKFAVKLPLGL